MLAMTTVASEGANIGGWLLEQAPVIVVMGVVIWWLAKRLVKSESEKDEMSKEVIKITTLWELKANKMDEEDKTTKKEILTLLQKIKSSLPIKK